MRVIVQRSLKSSVSVNKKIVGKIDKGLVLLVAFKKGDTEEEIDYLVKKILNLRIFEDEKGLMNKSLVDIKGNILSISQFTLYGNASNGNRPSFIDALESDKAKILYKTFNNKLKCLVPVETGIFGAEMLVNIKNDGPTTIILEKEHI